MVLRIYKTKLKISWISNLFDVLLGHFFKKMKEAGCGEGESCKGRFVVVDMQERQYNKEQFCEENMRVKQ